MTLKNKIKDKIRPLKHKKYIGRIIRFLILLRDLNRSRPSVRQFLQVPGRLRDLLDELEIRFLGINGAIHGLCTAVHESEKTLRKIHDKDHHQVQQQIARMERRLQALEVALDDVKKNGEL
ncbi:MAG: hypothetical protein ACK5O7_00845 [Holosporales bacterium]